MRRYVTTTACNFWRQIACSVQAKCGNVLLIGKKNIWNLAIFSIPVGDLGKKVHACSLRFSALKPCSGAHYSQGQIREYAPLPGNTYRTKNSPCNTYIIWPLERKKQTNISWKIKITKYKFQSKRKQGNNKNQNKWIL